LSTGTATWSAARDACSSVGSFLVQVDSPEENAFLYNTYGSIGNVWSCLNDISTEGTFQCAQGTSLYRNFAQMQPDDGLSNEDCVTLFFAASRWNDWSCTSLFRYVCEKDVVAQPTLLPTISFRPTPAPTKYPTTAHPTPRPTIDPQNVKSFHFYAYDSPLSGVSALRWGLYIEGAIYVILTFLQYYYRINELGPIKIALIYTMWLLIEIVILCGRADFMLNNGGDYEPHILKNGELVYFKSGLWNLGDHSRHQVGCPYNLEDSYPAPDNTCMYWFMPLNANLVSQGWVQFSLGVGLIIAIVFRIIAFGCKLVYDNREKVKHASAADAFCAGICGWLLVTIVELILHFQQFISLLPIEVILPNAYCLEVQVPVATMKAICRYKIAAAAIPIGLPISIGGFGVAVFFGSMAKQLTEGAQAFAVFCSLVGIIFGVYGLTFVIFWLFGGIVLGFWYVFGGVSLGYLTSDTNLILVLLSSSVFFLLLIEELIKFCSSGCRDYNAVKVAAENALELANQIPLG
jgi:hypothetical protein